MLPEVPKSVVVIGAGRHRHRVRRLLERLRRRGDGHRVHAAHGAHRGRGDLGDAGRARFKKKKMAMHTGAKTTGVKVERQDGHHLVHHRRRQEPERHLRARAAGGRACAPTSRTSASKAWASTLDRGFIQVDDHYQTTSPGIWAIGDCAGPPLLAHVAMAEGVRTAWRRWPGNHAERRQLRRHPRLHLLRPRGRLDRQDRGAGAGGGHRHLGGQVPVRASTARRWAPATPTASSRSSPTRRAARSSACTPSATG